MTMESGLIPHSPSRGFTLLGLMFAIAFVVTVVVALASLTARTLTASRASKERFIATALAREGIELVRALRDDNWLSYGPGTISMLWRGNPGGSAPEQERAICNGTWIISSENQRLAAPGGGSPNGKLFLASGANQLAYSHDVSGVPTIYQRRITIATGGTGSGDCGELVFFTQAPPPNPILVTSRVEWREHPTGPLRVVELREELFDWVKER